MYIMYMYVYTCIADQLSIPLRIDTILSIQSKSLIPGQHAFLDARNNVYVHVQ